jgi:hypothetical protein
MVKIRICPKCKEPTLRNAVNVSGWLAPDMYECTSCGYFGRFHVEVDSDDYELEQEELSEE